MAFFKMNNLYIFFLLLLVVFSSDAFSFSKRLPEAVYNSVKINHPTDGAKVVVKGSSVVSVGKSCFMDVGVEYCGEGRVGNQFDLSVIPYDAVVTDVRLTSQYLIGAGSDKSLFISVSAKDTDVEMTTESLFDEGWVSLLGFWSDKGVAPIHETLLRTKFMDAIASGHKYLQLQVMPAPNQNPSKTVNFSNYWNMVDVYYDSVSQSLPALTASIYYDGTEVLIKWNSVLSSEYYYVVKKNKSACYKAVQGTSFSEALSAEELKLNSYQVFAARGPLSSTCVGSKDRSSPTLIFCQFNPDSLFCPKEMILNGGIFGQWEGMQYCPKDQFVTGFRTRIEGDQKDNDDTGLNGVTLKCSSSDRKQVSYIGRDGFWGDWSVFQECSGNNLLVGAQIKEKAPQGNGYCNERHCGRDDEGATSLNVYCSDDDRIESKNERNAGDWNVPKACPIGYAVCGMDIRMEFPQGSGDDSALNAIKLMCCKVPETFNGSGYSGTDEQCALGSFDGVNCSIMPVPVGGFIYDNRFYVGAKKDTSDCPVGTFNGKDCAVMPKPVGGFIWAGSNFYMASVNGACPSDYYGFKVEFDGANCRILKAPYGTVPFESNGYYYLTPRPSCPEYVGGFRTSFDGANCIVARAPAGTNAFVYDGRWYISPRRM